MARGAVRWCAALAAAAVLAAGCGGGSTPQGSIKRDPKLAAVPLNVGSKDFTEQLVLGQIAILALRAAGAEVSDKTNIQGSVLTREALLGQHIDVYWDYTGTGWTTYLGQTEHIADATAQFHATAARDLAANGVKWMTMSPLDDTYAIAVRTETAKRLGVATLSDLAALSRREPSKATFCLEREFASRPDGYAAMVAGYGMQVPDGGVTQLSQDAVYGETAKGKTCTFGEVFATDAAIRTMGLTVLKDDRSVFPRYNAAICVRDDTYTQYPSMESLFAPIAQALTNTEMIELVAQVEDHDVSPADAARRWMQAKGFIA
jgi:osmoprotectant transport system substrate-binding protein